LVGVDGYQKAKYGDPKGGGVKGREENKKTSGAEGSKTYKPHGEHDQPQEGMEERLLAS